MEKLASSFRLLSALSLLCMTGLLATSCGDDDYEYDTLPGQGALIIDNHNGREDVNFFLEGELVGQIRDGHDRTFDLAPGVYRVVIIEEDSGLAFRDDIDIIEGRLTIIDVIGGNFGSGLDVIVSIQ